MILPYFMAFDDIAISFNFTFVGNCNSGSVFASTYVIVINFEIPKATIYGIIRVFFGREFSEKQTFEFIDFMKMVINLLS